MREILTLGELKNKIGLHIYKDVSLCDTTNEHGLLRNVNQERGTFGWGRVDGNTTS